MKKSLQRRLILMSLKALLSIFFVCLSSAMLIAAESKSQTLDDVYVKVCLKDSKIKEVFSLIEKQTGFKFFYDCKLTEKDQAINIDPTEQSVAAVLLEVGKQTGLNFKQINQTI